MKGSNSPFGMQVGRIGGGPIGHPGDDHGPPGVEPFDRRRGDLLGAGPT